MLVLIGKIILGIFAVMALIGLCLFFYGIYTAPIVPPDDPDF